LNLINEVVYSLGQNGQLTLPKFKKKRNSKPDLACPKKNFSMTLIVMLESDKPKILLQHDLTNENMYLVEENITVIIL
jgi:hypothetical protein